jgi:mRNA-degrading endonuclease RelE of RelBE toxin-antitoxin system
MVSIIPSTSFKKSVKHLDSAQRVKLEKIIRKIINNPFAGKPLRYTRGERVLRNKPFRVVYAYRSDTTTLYLLKFDHRKSVYE